MLPRRVAPLRRSFGRVVRRQYGGGRLPEPSGAAAADAEPNNWPVLAGSVLACSMVAAGIAARSDWLMKRVQACMDSPAADGTSLFQIGGLMAAFTIAQLPADDLKLRLLGSGAARSWGRLVASFEADVQQVGWPCGESPLPRGPKPLPLPQLQLISHLSRGAPAAACAASVSVRCAMVELCTQEAKARPAAPRARRPAPSHRLSAVAFPGGSRRDDRPARGPRSAGGFPQVG